MKRVFTRVFILASSLCIGLFWALPTSAATYTVNSTVDSNDGTCVHPFIDATQDCTLREAIVSANAGAGPHTITFNIQAANFPDDGDGQFTITLTSGLPVITEIVTLTGSAMWDSTGTVSDRPGIRLNGASAGVNAIGLSLNTSNSKIKALTIDNFDASGISINDVNNIIGTDCDEVQDARERNVIINNGGAGIILDTAGDQNRIAGNYIGVSTDGSTDAGNDSNGITIAGDSNDIGYTSNKCTAAEQRNVISGNSADGIFITGDSNSVSGNYIGITASGDTALQNTESGIDIQGDSTLNILGTDGDGTTDAAEMNVISGNGEHGVTISEEAADDGAGGPDENRIAGNIIGLSAALNSVLANGQHGIYTAADNIIIGWCDSTVSATLCNNGGTQDTQANVLFTNATDSDGIHLGVRADALVMYGNYIGITAAGTDPGNLGRNGVAIEKRNGAHLIGGTATEEGNTISNFQNGLRAYITTTGLQSPSENITIEGNTISNNTATGVRCDETLEFASGSYTYENTVRNNTITENAGSGIVLEGCSWNIQSNTVTTNGGWGIYVKGKERPDDPHPDELSPGDVAGSNYSNPYDAPSPNNSANDLVSRPQVQSNTVSGNTSGGMYFLDTSATNAATLYTDNTFASNNNQNHIEQAWYGAIELTNANDTVISSGSRTVTLTPDAGSCSTCTGSTVDIDGVSGNAIWGPVNIDYNNAGSWFTVPDYSVNSSGVKTQYNPYTITVSGDSVNTTGVEYSFNGSDDDAASQAGAPNGITTNGVYRYQIAEVSTSSVPSQPTNQSPAHGATSVSTTPTLTASTFSDSAHSHAASSWRIYSTSELCAAGGAGNIVDTESSTQLTSFTVPSGELTSSTTYYWTVSYENNFGNASSPSACTAFTTLQTAPSFSGSIDHQTWDEDEALSQALDLDDYFTDQEGEALTYSVANSEADTITITINSNNVVSFSADDDWFGTGTATFTACDTDAECTSSNEITLTVSSVNDAPTAPNSGFSPANGDVTSDTTPRITWDASTDVDHSASQLHYVIRLGTDPDPSINYTYSATTSNDQVAHTVTSELQDGITYYYVIRAIDPADGRSNWSTVQEFSVNTEVAPSLTVTKEVERVDQVSQVIQDIQSILARAFLLPIPLPVHGLDGGTTLFTLVQVILHTVLWLSVLGIGLLLVALLAMGRSWRDVGHLLASTPTKAFERVHQTKVDTIDQDIFQRFKIRLIALRTILSIAALVFFSMLVANATEAPSILQATIRTLAQTVTVEPDNTIEVTLSYENTGDGSATSPVFIDSIPTGTNFVAGSLTVNDTAQSDSFVAGSAITVPTTTITAVSDSTNNNGTVSYQLQIDNPYTSATLGLAAATVTANELAEAVTSNTLTLTVDRAVVSGEVVTVAGNGVGDAVVRIYLEGDHISTSTTNSAGQYSISGLGDGTYIVEVVAPSGYLTPATRTVVVSAGTAYTDIDFTLYRQSIGDTDDSIDDSTTTDDEDTQTDDTTEDSQDTDTDTTLEEILLDLGIPQELLSDFDDIDLPSEQEAALIQELTEQLNIVSINDQLNTTLELDSSTTAIGSLLDDVADLLFPASNDITLEGVGPPNAKITVSICYVISETSTDSEGKWVMVIPESVLQPGENVFYATAEKDGVVSEQVEVARVVVDQPSLISRTALLAYISTFVVIITLNSTGYIVLVRRQRKLGVKPHTQFWVWATIVCVLLSLAALFGSFAAQQWRTYDVSAEARQLQQGITMETVNDTQLPPGQNADFANANTVHFSGEAPAQTNLAITLCDNQPFRTTTANQDGTWDMFVPVDLLPTARFTISAQSVAGDWLGDPHRLVDLDIVSRDLLLQVNILLTAAYVLLFISAATLWWHSQMNTVPRITITNTKQVTKI